MNENGDPYTILVEFDLKPGTSKAFMPLMLENARRSLADEPGCITFDVLTRAEDAERVVLYEIYRDKAAFSEHLKAPHFLSFDSGIRNYVAAKRVTELVIESPVPSVAN